jgi:V8-like Glu-specific endopeptidase
MTLIIAGAQQSVSHAATGDQWPNGEPFTGYLQTDGFGGGCTVTVVSQFLAITAKHCSPVNAELKLNLATVTEPGHVYAVTGYSSNPDLDVQAIFLRDRSGLDVTPLTAALTPDPAFLWGYGMDTSDNFTGHLTRASFHAPLLCDNNDSRLSASSGELCWQPSSQGSVCFGDSGGPVMQNGKIIGMMTTIVWPTGSTDCGKTMMVQAISVRQMQAWLIEMIDKSNH